MTMNNDSMALVEVFKRIWRARRGLHDAVPSIEVTQKAQRYLDTKAIDPVGLLARVYTVQGTEDYPYHVELFMRPSASTLSYTITSAWCSCPARTEFCAHIMTALARAEQQGIHFHIPAPTPEED